MMKHSNDKNKQAQNPVGPVEPLIKIDIPLWQVFVALFLIALVLTAFKWFERNNIAPNKTVIWRSLDLKEFRQERLRRTNILLWIRSPSDQDDRNIMTAFQEPSIRTAVYMNRCLTFTIDRDPPRAEDLNDWLANNLQELAEGGLAYWVSSEKRPEILLPREITNDSVLELLDGG